MSDSEILQWSARSAELDAIKAGYDLEKIRAAGAMTLEALRMCLSVLHNADLRTGYCCCGSKVDMHIMGDGHSPVDEGTRYQYEAIDAARKAIDVAMN